MDLIAQAKTYLKEVGPLAAGAVGLLALELQRGTIHGTAAQWAELAIGAATLLGIYQAPRVKRG